MDLSTFDREGLASIVASMGFDDVDHLSREELERLVKSLNGVDTSFDGGAATSADVVVGMAEDPDVDSVAAREDSSVSLAAAINGAEGSRLDSTVAIDSMDQLSDPEHESLLAEFVSVSGAEVDVARTVLESTGWDLQNALLLFLEEGAAPAPPVRTPFVTDPTERIHDFMEHIRQLHHGHDDDIDDFDPDSPKRGDVYDDDGVRRPDPVKIQRLVHARAASDRDDMQAFARAEDPSVDWLHAPPTHLYSHNSLEKTMEQAAADGRWVLVNIQSHLEFASHELNRVVWRNDTIESLLRGGLIFWQRGHTTAHGRDFLRIYKLAENDLPWIGILHPATGAVRFSWTGFIDAEDLCAALVDFLDKNSLATALSVGKEDASPRPAERAQRPIPAPQLVPVSAPAPLPVFVAPVLDYGTVPAEPDSSEPDVIKVSLKLPSKTLARRYRKTDPVRVLFAVALANSRDQTPFELFTRYPMQNLAAKLDATLEECSLANSQVAHRAL